MGNSCCASKDFTQLVRNQELLHQTSSRLISHKRLYSNENLMSSENEDENKPIKQYPTITTMSKIELDYLQTSFVNRTRKQNNGPMYQSLMERRSIRINYDSFVTLKQRKFEDHYDVIDKIGSGSYGNVWKVKHKQTGLIRAMKQIKRASLILEDQKRMLSEINILKSLDHPNIVKVYECYADDICYFIITEFLPGGELFNRIKKLNIFNERCAADYMRQILRAISYCHEKKIVHRDIKPENILLDVDHHTLKVIDFGTSREFNYGTNMKKRLGTPYYLAPEVIKQQYNEKVDVWSSGIILYIFLCGYPPFAGKTDKETLQKVQNGIFSFDQHDWSLISREAQDLVSKMICINVDKRLSAKEALNHPWIIRFTYPDIINNAALQNLQKFQAQSCFKKAMLSFIVNQTMSHPEMRELQNTFMGLDKNQDGFLSKQELTQGYQELVPNRILAEEKVNLILEYVDINQSGHVDYSEFIMAAMNLEKLTSMQNVKQAFQMLDLNNDGYLSKGELEEAMGCLGEDVWEQYLLDCDFNHDGKISQEEFTNLLLAKT